MNLASLSSIKYFKFLHGGRQSGQQSFKKTVRWTWNTDMRNREGKLLHSHSEYYILYLFTWPIYFIWSLLKSVPISLLHFDLQLSCYLVSLWSHHFCSSSYFGVVIFHGSKFSVRIWWITMQPHFHVHILDFWATFPIPIAHLTKWGVSNKSRDRAFPLLKLRFSHQLINLFLTSRIILVTWLKASNETYGLKLTLNSMNVNHAERRGVWMVCLLSNRKKRTLGINFFSRRWAAVFLHWKYSFFFLNNLLQ